MKFTYESYAAMLMSLQRKGYKFRNYKTWQEEEKTVIIRHDVDNSLQKAVVLSEIEKDVCEESVEATYFLLLATNFYNVHSRESRECISKITKNGGNIGLHFDETQYNISDIDEMKDYVDKEAEILSNVINAKVEVVSMHRPSEKVLSKNIVFPDIINSYSEVYFKQMKYLSDSRRHWREKVDDIIDSGIYPRLHILTHPFWYMRSYEKTLKQTLIDAVVKASLDYYDSLNNNFRNLGTELEKNEIERIINACNYTDI